MCLLCTSSLQRHVLLIPDRVSDGTCTAAGYVVRLVVPVDVAAVAVDDVVPVGLDIAVAEDDVDPVGLDGQRRRRSRRSFL